MKMVIYVISEIIILLLIVGIVEIESATLT